MGVSFGRASALVLIGAILPASEQDLSGQTVKKSQRGMVMQMIATTRVSIVYNRPTARGRKLFGPGGLVPYGKEWNPGADEATAIDITRDVLIDGQELPAGRYSIWAIPGENEWTWIFSRAHDVFHIPYPKGQDALRIKLKPEPGPHMETLAFYFPVVEPARAILNFHWGEVVVRIPIAVK